jgi:hypothetical protein
MALVELLRYQGRYVPISWCYLYPGVDPMGLRALDTQDRDRPHQDMDGPKGPRIPSGVVSLGPGFPLGPKA